MAYRYFKIKKVVKKFESKPTPVDKNIEKSKLTAISRKKISVPTQYLLDKKLITGKVLDFGCGRGFDAITNKWHKYDPNFFPTFPKGKFDTIICNYVLNVLPKRYEQKILGQTSSLLKKTGVAYITVRRDKGTNAGYTSRGTFQRLVKLPFKSIRKTSTYEIYRFVRES